MADEIEQEKNSFSACRQGCTVKVGHRVFTLCSSDFIYLFIFFTDLGLHTEKTSLIRLQYVCLGKVSKHKGKALTLKGDFARTPYCIGAVRAFPGQGGRRTKSSQAEEGTELTPLTICMTTSIEGLSGTWG